MPYKTNGELPKAVRDALPAPAQTIFRNAYNSAEKQNDSEEASAKIAWSAVKKEFKKNSEGNWVKKSKEIMPEADANVEEAEQEVETEERYVGWGITSFEELEAQDKERERIYKINELTSTYLGIIENIMYSSNIQDKSAAVRQQSQEFTMRLDSITANEVAENANGEMELREDVEFVNLQESIVPGTFLEAEVQIIKPGWGNPRDNHYYPAEVLQRDADKFLGAKMYESDHNQHEKSTRTWVSTIYDILRFTEEGAPVALVRIHDMNFAQRLMNLKAESLLDKMECSIMASALGEANFEKDGKKGHKITEFVQVHDVDWVTKAGAGGKVLALNENLSTMEDGMDDLKKKEQEEELAESEKPVTPVTVREKDDDPTPETDAEPEVEEKFLSSDEVEEYLKLSGLPEISKKRLTENEYHDTNELASAATAEAEYVKELMGSGEVRGLGEVETQERKKSLLETPISELQERKRKLEEGYDQITEKYF